MISEFVLAVVALLLFATFFKGGSTKGKQLPGPYALPLLGNALQVGRKPHLTFTKWARIYGPIYRIKMGPVNAVILSHHAYIKEMFNDIASAGRLVGNPIVREFAKGPNGVFNSQGRIWDEQRKFTMRTLQHNFGFSKSSMEMFIVDEAQVFIEWFRKSTGKPIPGSRIFNAPVINSLWRIVTGERFEWEDKRPYVLDTAENFFEIISEVSVNGILFVPFMRHITPKFFKWDKFIECTDDMLRIFKDSIEEHKKTLDPDNLRDFIDHYIVEAEKVTDPESSFYKQTGEVNLEANILDFFLGGSETTSNILSWAMLYLGAHQDVQTKLQNEIDSVLGASQPSLSDKTRLPFAEALISEMLRVVSVAAWGVPHQMMEDMIFRDYFIPKGTVVFSNIYGAHYDPDVWGDPLKFRPERFLSSDGKKCVRNEALIPFSEGKRKCIGETLSKNTLFIFITSIFQQFNVQLDLPEGAVPDFESRESLLLNPKPFKIIVQLRN